MIMKTVGDRLTERFGWKWKVVDHATSLAMCAAFIYLSWTVRTYYLDVLDKCPCYLKNQINITSNNMTFNMTGFPSNVTCFDIPAQTQGGLI